MINVLQHFIFYAVLVYIAKPEDVRSTGMHQMVGPCNKTEETFSLTGVVSSTGPWQLSPYRDRKYFCF